MLPVLSTIDPLAAHSTVDSRGLVAGFTFLLAGLIVGKTFLVGIRGRRRPIILGSLVFLFFCIHFVAYGGMWEGYEDYWAWDMGPFMIYFTMSLGVCFIVTPVIVESLYGFLDPAMKVLLEPVESSAANASAITLPPTSAVSHSGWYFGVLSRQMALGCILGNMATAILFRTSFDKEDDEFFDSWVDLTHKALLPVCAFGGVVMALFSGAFGDEADWRVRSSKQTVKRMFSSCCGLSR